MTTVSTLVDFYSEEEFRNLKLKMEERISHDSTLKLSVFSIICNSNFVELLQSNIEKFEINIEKKEDYWKIVMERVIKRSDMKSGKRIISGTAFVAGSGIHNKIWHILTVEDLDFQRICLERLIDLLRPQVSRFYLTSSEIKSIFTTIEDRGFTIMVKKAILYSHKEEGEISFRKLPYYRIFHEAEESDMYVDKVEFVIERDHSLVLHGFVTREGMSKFIGGDITFFYERFLPLLANYGEEKRKKLDKKEKNVHYEVHPLTLKFEKNIIRDKKDNIEIIRSLQNLKRSSVLVYHSNPYLHLSLLDFTDGSSCDVFVSSPDALTIIPSYNSTLSSLMRIFNHLSKDFQEGEIIEKERENIQFADFFE
jgi:hypothetical protein